jgi:hypothetical protein
MKSKLAKAVAVSTLLMSFAGANAFAQVADPYGVAADRASPEREIVVSPTTKHVNVNQGEVVKFVSEGKSFTWKFDTFAQRPFEMQKIAPKDFVHSNPTVYLGANPLYFGQ